MGTGCAKALHLVFRIDGRQGQWVKVTGHWSACLNDAGRVAHYDRLIGHIPGYDGHCANDCTVADSHAGQYGRSSTNPDATANRNRLRHQVEVRSVNVMAPRAKEDIVSDNGLVAH
jgi:hypothetical protein